MHNNMPYYLAILQIYKHGAMCYIVFTCETPGAIPAAYGGVLDRTGGPRDGKPGKTAYAAFISQIERTMFCIREHALLGKSR